MTAVAQRVSDDFEYSAEVAERMAPVYDRVKEHITADE